MSDVLTISVTLPDGKYPSKNQEGKDGFRGGRKSDAYRYLFDAVKDAAEAEIARTGWLKAECDCMVTVMRVMPKRYHADAVNMATAECNALTKAGVWTDDNLGNPAQKLIRYDDKGPHRVVIVVMKLHQPVVSVPVASMNNLTKSRKMADTLTSIPESRKARAAEKPPGVITWDPTQPIPAGYAQLGATLIPLREARELISKNR